MLDNLENIYILPREIAERGLDIGPHILISICDNGFPAVRPFNGEVIDILRLEFIDIDINKCEPEILNAVMFGKVVGECLVQPSHGVELKNFLEQHKDVKNIVIHCYAGVSRSVSMAQAIVDAFKISRSILVIYTGKSRFGPPPNKAVYQVMKGALDVLG